MQVFSAYQIVFCGVCKGFYNFHVRSAVPHASYIGRQAIHEDVLVAGPLERFAAWHDVSLEALAPAGIAPPLFHWLYFHNWVAASELGADGHPRRGAFLPPIDLPRRMKAGARIEFLRALRIGDPLRRHTTIESIVPKSGASGPLVFVTLRTEISGPSGLAVIETEDIVYRAAGLTPAVRVPETATFPEGAITRRVVPTPVSLFRFSSLTHNSHRIHYDHPYATAVEGYPGLVVHAPLQVMLLLDLARAMQLGGRPSHMRFQARRPLFDTSAFWCVGQRSAAGAELSTHDLAGNLCLAATLSVAPSAP